MDNPKNQNSISRYVKLEDYKVFDYEIPEIFLDFVIKKNAVNVTTKLKLVKKNKNTRNLILDGTDILIKKLFIDDSLLGMEYYKQQKNNLKIENINKFSKEKETSIVRLEQNYRSTQKILNAANAVIGKKNIMQAANKSFISSTFWTERVGSTAALETLKIMKLKHLLGALGRD